MTFVDHEAELSSGTIAWREAGAGEPLIFLHGLGGTRGSWNPQLTHFAPNRRCIAWDMPGYGGSSGERPLTFERIAARLVELLDHLDITAADVVGLSFGGMHALHLALHAPTRVRRLVLADTSPAFGLDGTTAEGWKAARLAPIGAGETPASLAPVVLDAIAGRPLDPTLRDELVDAFARISTDGFRAAVECLPHHDVRSRLGEIAQPTLVIVGELDEETPPPYSEALVDGIPDAALTVLSGVGHLSPSEDPGTFNDVVERFLTVDTGERT